MLGVKPAQNIEHVSGEALIGLIGAALTKDEEQRFLECDRRLMLTHFRAANEKIARLEHEKVQATAANTQLADKVQTERANHFDICDYLRGEIHNKNLVVNELQVRRRG